LKRKGEENREVWWEISIFMGLVCLKMTKLDHVVDTIHLTVTKDFAEALPGRWIGLMGSILWQLMWETRNYFFNV